MDCIWFSTHIVLKTIQLKQISSEINEKNVWNIRNYQINSRKSEWVYANEMSVLIDDSLNKFSQKIKLVSRSLVISIRIVEKIEREMNSKEYRFFFIAMSWLANDNWLKSLIWFDEIANE